MGWPSLHGHRNQGLNKHKAPQICGNDFKASLWGERNSHLGHPCYAMVNVASNRQESNESRSRARRSGPRRWERPGCLGMDREALRGPSRSVRRGERKQESQPCGNLQGGKRPHPPPEPVNDKTEMAFGWRREPSHSQPRPR